MLVCSRMALVVVCLVIGGFGVRASLAAAASTPMVDLGQASTYAVLSGASVGNTVSAVGAPYTTLRGDLGVKANAQPTGFPPGVVTGTIRVGDATVAQAHADLVAAYTEVAARTGGTALAGDLTGAVILPGLYTIAGAVSNGGTLTLDAEGNPNAVFVFQVNGALAMAAASHVVLTNGARATNVFWQVNGAGSVGASADFAGTLMALDAVGVGNGSLFNGRAFARNGALTLDNNQFYSAPPIVTIAGGATATTTDTTPTISGTTDVEELALVTVTINGQTLTTSPTGGVWSVTSAILANGTYTVNAAVSDGAGNPGSASQQLTVDTVLPVIVIDGGPSLTTNDSTPTITGTSDVAPGTIVRVSISLQTLTTLVQSDGSWNITPTTLTDGDRTITVSVFDPAGNEGTDSQLLSIDTAAPAVTIDGGASSLTNDATPDISGTADVEPGTTVTVSLADQTLTASVQSGGAWATTAAAVSDGPHRIIMSVSDAAGNSSTFTQILTVDTQPPIVAINGGATATTSDGDPTIIGSSDAALGTIVTVTIASQTMTTVVQDDGTWNVTPTFVGEGTWDVGAWAADPAGNVGSSTQSLTITFTGAIAAMPTGTATLNVSSATVGTQLLATVIWSRPATATYQWFRNGSAIVGATTINYTVTQSGLGTALWLVASVIESGQTVTAVTAGLTPRATALLSLFANTHTVRAGRLMYFRVRMRSLATVGQQRAQLRIWHKIGGRWILRRRNTLATNTAGVFTLAYRPSATGIGSWRARAVFPGTAGILPVKSLFWAFTVK